MPCPVRVHVVFRCFLLSHVFSASGTLKRYHFGTQKRCHYTVCKKLISCKDTI